MIFQPEASQPGNLLEMHIPSFHPSSIELQRLVWPSNLCFNKLLQGILEAANSENYCPRKLVIWKSRLPETQYYK